MSAVTITILSHDLSGNALSRAWMLAKLLECDYRVHIVGFGDGEVWEPVRNDRTVEYRPFCHGNVASYVWQAPRTIRRLIEGNLILAVKPIQASFGLALRARRMLNRPLMLDIDDWELGFLSDSVYWEARLLGTNWVTAVNSPLFTRLLERHIKHADAVTVSSRFLQKRYGGYWIGQARDERVFSPQRFCGIARDGRTVLFLGSAREHKGLDQLLDAWRLVHSPRARLRVVGTPLDSPIIRKLMAQADPRVEFAGPVPFERVPETIASASVFVVPQREGRASIGQVPMKMIDAMALGCPVVATAVGDIPDWLGDDAGIVVPPSDSSALAEAISKLLQEPNEAQAIGRRARQQFLELASFESVRRRLLPVVGDLIAGRKPAPPEEAFAQNYRLRSEENVVCGQKATEYAIVSQ